MDKACRTQPDSDEFELVLFGPGYGECILLHVGCGNWVVVDSCLDPEKVPVALRYLTEIGVDPPSAVSAVIATHWHEDHIRGMSKVLENCPRAAFCCASALSKPEFLGLVNRSSGEGVTRLGLGAREFQRVMNLLEERDQLPKYAGQNRKLFSFGKCEIWSLSPTDEVYNAFLKTIAEQMEGLGVSGRRVFTFSPNLVSVVLTVHSPSTAILLGADLEVKGWSGILHDFPHSDWIASLFKVPHHGSKTGDAPEVWEDLLKPNPHVVLTPWQRGRGRLPSIVDAQRILDRTPNAWITSMGHYKPTRKRIRSRALKRLIRHGQMLPRPIYSEFGFIRLRRKMREQGDWTVFTQGRAGHLKEYLQ